MSHELHDHDHDHDVVADDPVDERSPLMLPLAALLTTQVFHIAATVANDGEPTAHHAEIGPPAHIAATLFTMALLVWVRRRGPHSAALTAATGAAVVIAAVLYHVLPVESDFTNPFWDGATTAQQISVLAGIIAGTWCLVRGLRADRPLRPRHQQPRTR
jgi:peptidoglycan/LPS O-acetylase OafA/YrhL